MPERTYGPVVSPYLRFLFDAPSSPERIERMEFHIKNSDYFALLATALGFLEETLGECEGHADLALEHKKLVEGLRDDLRYLHQHYEITKRAVPLTPAHRGIRTFA